MLTGRVRKGQETDVVRARFLNAFSDERRLDAVEQLILLAEEVGLPRLSDWCTTTAPPRRRWITTSMIGDV